MGRILILANSAAGLYKFRNELLVELTKEHEVYASLPDHDYDEEFAGEKITVIDTSINRRGVNPIQDAKLFANYLKIIKDINPDVVLTYTIKPNVYGGLACAIKKVPYLANVTGLGSALQNPGMLQTITKALYKTGIRKASTVFMQNQANYDYFKVNKMTKAEMILLPGSGVNTEKFSLLPWPDNTKTFAFISRVMKEKGIDEYLECAQAIKKRYENAQFHVLGPCEEDYEKKLEDMSNNGTIIYHGMVKDVRPYLEKIGCVVLPSYHEGMSNVCLEAASSGRVVITTDTHGCKETVIANETGFLVSVGDSDSLVQAVGRYMSLSDGEQKNMGLLGRKHVEENFDRNIIVNLYKEKIDQIIK